MNLFLSISWAQSILIYLGALMQLAAIVALIKQKSGYRMLPRHGEQLRHIEHEEFRHEHPEDEDEAPKYSNQDALNYWPSSRPTMNAGNFPKTASPNLKQTVEFRQ